MEYQVKKVAITGASGPIGLALVQHLLDENIEMLIFQRKDSLRGQRIPKHPLITIVDSSLETLDEYKPREKNFDVFFHLGWANTMWYLREDVYAQLENVTGTCKAVELANRLGCHTFIGVGSQSEYGRHDEALTGETQCHPEDAYGTMKLCSCYASRVLCNQQGIRHIWTRVLSSYGYYDNVGSILVSTIIKSLLGEELTFSKGEQIWDFVYTGDIAEALLLVAKKGRNNVIYPIGSGEARPLYEYIKILGDCLGKREELQIGVLPYRENQVMHLEADISQLQQDTGWKPKTSFEEGMKLIIAFYTEWLKENKELYFELRAGIEKKKKKN